MDEQKDQTLDHATTQPRNHVPCPACDEYLATAKRALADYANLKKETERAKIEFSKFANERLLDSLLPAIDSFETAIAHAPASTDETWLAGLNAVKGIWDAAFREIGLTKVSTDGAFDPLIHEAAGEEHREDANPGDVARVLQDGWSLNGKLLRPARVIISKSGFPPSRE